MAKPTTAIEPAASSGLREQSVPSVMKTAPDAREPEVGPEPVKRRAAELDEHEQRKGAERSDERGLRLLDHLVGNREDHRDDDRGACCGLESGEVGHGPRS